MNFDDLKAAWKCQNKTDFAKLNPDQLIEHLRFEETFHNRAQLWTNIFVAGFFACQEKHLKQASMKRKTNRYSQKQVLI